jgi:alpha-mannosidase
MGALSQEQYSQLIKNAASRLRLFSQRDVQKKWQQWGGDRPPTEAYNPSEYLNWAPVALNEKGHIPWPAGRQDLWLGQVFRMPRTEFKYPCQGLIVRLALTWWAEKAEIYVNGQLVQEGDLFDCSARVVLTESLVPETEVSVLIHLVSPNHDSGALVRSLRIFEPPTTTVGETQRIDPGILANELEVLRIYLEAFQPDALKTVVDAFQDMAWPFNHELEQCELDWRNLRLKLQPWGDWLKQRQINWIGHAHLDLAWLWPVAETWEAAERTFVSALNLQKDFDELNFCHSSPALYHWIEQHRPALFAQIQQRVAEGRWEVAAGLWVEPELNLISGESLVRQVLYGQRYTQERFGHISRVAWLPDSFGFCSQLPQILKQGGVDYFLTQKLRWNDTTQFPHEAFWWEAPDGTRIFSVMTPPIGESIDPIKMSTHAKDWEVKTSLKESFWLPGVGDHGGGPTRDMLEVARKWQQSPLFPQLKPSTMTEFCQQVESNLQDVPVWDDELYLEFHRGCYTSHADQKRYNRRCEHWLTEAEMFSAIATLLTHAPYPKAELETAWKKVLFNQFHDILPGSSIPEVFLDANQEWELAQQMALELREKALGAIAAHIHLPNPPVPDAVPIIVYNSLNWERSEVVSWQIPDHLPTGGSVWDDGLPTSSHSEDRTLLFFAEMPSLGYRTFWYAPTTPSQLPAPKTPSHWILENALLRVEVCPKTGILKSVWDGAAQREVLAGAGNQLQFFQDQGQYWDAWNIDPNYANHALEAATLKEITWVCGHGLQQRLRVVLQWRNSVFTQDYVLDWNSPILKIETQVDWQETHVLVKAAFPVTVTAEFATYEVPCGAITRPTLPNSQLLSDHQKAKWEVPGLHWADLTQSGEDGYGISVLNDCKYGYDSQPSCLRLTLLRSPTWPDPECDRGSHQFTYALYPHSGSWQSSQTVRRGYELNRPLIAQTLAQISGESGVLPQAQSFLSSFAENLVLMAFKQSEDFAQQWVIRCYEACGQSAPMTLNTTLPIQYSGNLDGLEQPIPETSNRIEPWQVRSQRWT